MSSSTIWPFGKFPVLVDDGEVVAETSCIIEHLQVRHPGPNMWIPDGEPGRRTRFLDRVFDLHVQGNFQPAVNNALRPADAKDDHGEALGRKNLRIAYDWLEANLPDSDMGGGRPLHPRGLRRRASIILRRLDRARSATDRPRLEGLPGAAAGPSCGRQVGRGGASLPQLFPVGRAGPRLIRRRRPRP